METMSSHIQRKSDRGFTLIEIIAVLLLLVILAAVAIARVADTNADVIAASDKLKVHLRHAQGRAMNSDMPWGVEAVGGSYHLFYYDGAQAVKHRFLGEDHEDVSFPGGISATFTVSFDQWGRPYTVENPAAGSPSTAATTITVGSKTVTITPDTGYIQ